MIGLHFRCCFTTWFLEIFNDISKTFSMSFNDVVSKNEYALEFASDGIFLRFWQGDKLCRVFLKRTGRTQGQSQAKITLISHVMGAISRGPEIISVTGCTSQTVELLAMSPYGQYAVQSPPRFEELHLKTLMHKKASSVFGLIPFFGVLQYLIVCLGSSLELEWMMLSPELSKVAFVMLSDQLPSKFLFGVSMFQAIRTCQLDLNGLHTLCQELLKYWFKVTDYLTQHSASQEMQGVRKQVWYNISLLQPNNFPKCPL